MKDAMYIAEARDLRKVYEMGFTKVEALQGVDICVHKGEFLGIMGPSGSGKSTLLHIIGCLEKPTQGTYFLGGQDVSYLSDNELSLIRATQIGFVSQSFNLISHYSVLENVTMPFLYRKESSREAKHRSEAAIEKVYLSERRNHKPFELSGGEMQRVAIARALVVEPLMLLADEPTGNLDSETSKTIISLFSELNELGATIILVTHEEAAASQCRRTIRLLDGKIVDSEVCK
jgi:putative ABC transport system ATP-binding protein